MYFLAHYTITRKAILVVTSQKCCLLCFLAAGDITLLLCVLYFVLVIRSSLRRLHSDLKLFLSQATLRRDLRIGQRTPTCPFRSLFHCRSLFRRRLTPTRRTNRKSRDRMMKAYAHQRNRLTAAILVILPKTCRKNSTVTTTQ